MAESREELLAKLGELEEQGEPAARTAGKPRNKPGVSPFDEGWVSDQEPYVPELRYVKEEPNYSKDFKVGDFFPQSRWSDGHLERQAVPHPNYDGNPDDLITAEMETKFWDEWQIWHTASMALERCIRLHLEISEFPNYSTRRPDKEELKQEFEKDWQWLKGLWAATPGTAEPSESQLTIWAGELRARWDAAQKRVASQSEQEKPAAITSTVQMPVQNQKPLDPNNASDPRHPFYGTLVRNAPR